MPNIDGEKEVFVSYEFVNELFCNFGLGDEFFTVNVKLEGAIFLFDFFDPWNFIVDLEGLEKIDFYDGMLK